VFRYLHLAFPARVLAPSRSPLQLSQFQSSGISSEAKGDAWDSLGQFLPSASVIGPERHESWDAGGGIAVGGVAISAPLVTASPPCCTGSGRGSRSSDGNSSKSTGSGAISTSCASLG